MFNQACHKFTLVFRTLHHLTRGSEFWVRTFDFFSYSPKTLSSYILGFTLSPKMTDSLEYTCTPKTHTTNVSLSYWRYNWNDLKLSFGLFCTYFSLWVFFLPCLREEEEDQGLLRRRDLAWSLLWRISRRGRGPGTSGWRTRCFPGSADSRRSPSEGWLGRTWDWKTQKRKMNWLIDFSFRKESKLRKTKPLIVFKKER